MKHQHILFLTTLLVTALAVSACGSDPVPVAATIEVAPLSGTIAPGETLQLTATAKDTANVVLAVTFTWLSDNTLAATVSSTGLVTAVANGSANVTATADGKSGSAAIAVQLVASVAVTPSNSLLHIGASTQLVATAFDGSGNVLTGLAVGWSSDDEDVATVDANGLVTAVAFGTALVTAEVDGTNGVASVRAQEPVTGSWTGGFDWPDVGGSCGLTLSLTEDATGAFTGTGTLTGPACVSVPVTFAGTNSAHVVMFTLSSSGRPDVPFSGNFDGKTEITGAFSGGIVSTNFLITRTSSTPAPPSATAPGVASGAHSSYARPEGR